MSTYRKNHLMIYLRPLDVPPYRLLDCAKRMCIKGWFPTVELAFSYLKNLELYNERLFRNVIAQYYQETDVHYQYESYRTDINSYRTNYGVNYNAENYK